jgi:hypothetical protein
MSKKKLDWNKPIQTRAGSQIKIYEVFDSRYVNGAVYDETDDVWYVYSWCYDGSYTDKPCSLDLVNCN